MRRGYQTDPFTDLLFNALLGFTFLFLVAVMIGVAFGVNNFGAEFFNSLLEAFRNGNTADGGDSLAVQFG